MYMLWENMPKFEVLLVVDASLLGRSLVPLLYRKLLLLAAVPYALTATYCVVRSWIFRRIGTNTR